MTRAAHAIEVVEKRYSYFPKRFRWRGKLFDVVGVGRVWCETRQWPQRRQRRLYDVLTSIGRFELCHDLLHDVWTIRRAPALPELQPVRARSALRRTRNEYRLAVVRWRSESGS
jgi:hypothetical protein